MYSSPLSPVPSNLKKKIFDEKKSLSEEAITHKKGIIKEKKQNFS